MRDRRFVAEHALGPALHALKAVRAAERRWQDEELPEASRELVLSARQAPRVLGL